VQTAKLLEAFACLFYGVLLFARSRSRLDQEQPKEDKMTRITLLAMLLATSPYGAEIGTVWLPTSSLACMSRDNELT
jgi:hypothetical protein